MQIAVVSCSFHRERTDRTVAVLAEHLRTVGHVATPVALDPFDRLFTGRYTTLEDASPPQHAVLSTLVAAEALLFVVPSYYKSMPGAAKNFFDVVRCPQAYDGAVVGFVASNHKNQDLAARETQRVVAALTEFHDVAAVLVPEIPVIDPDDVDPAAVRRTGELLERYGSGVRRPGRPSASPAIGGGR